MVDGMKRKIWKTAVVLFVFGTLSAVFVAADEPEGHESGRSVDAILSDIRDEQGIGPGDRIDPDQVDPALLEQLGEAVMSLMVPDPQQHEWMDRMMGGEGSESLAERHRWMGYRYLSGGGRGPMGMMTWRGFGRRGGPAPMMGFSPWGAEGDRRYGGMMGFGYGGLLVWIIVAVLAAAVVVLAVLYTKRRRGARSSESPDALDILKKRFARGEITREEYEQVRRDLRG